VIGINQLDFDGSWHGTALCLYVRHQNRSAHIQLDIRSFKLFSTQSCTGILFHGYERKQENLVLQSLDDAIGFAVQVASIAMNNNPRRSWAVSVKDEPGNIVVQDV
jgi:hypothetical protein